jgi:ribonuclease J
LVHHKETFRIRPKKRGTGYTRLKGKASETERPLKTFRYGKGFNVGSLEVEPFEVDHSLPGATAYLIHTSEGTILYTGDFRFHGYKEEETRGMIEAAAEEDVEVVVTEGTRVDELEGNTEADVLRDARKVVDGTEGLVAVNFPSRDLARLKTFHSIAQETRRKLVLTFKQAYLLEEFSKLGDDYPDLDDPHLCFYADRKSWGLIGRDDYSENIVEQDYRTWEREYLYRENTVNHMDVKSNQGDYMFYCNYFQINELIDIDPSPRSIYIRSVCEPFNEEMLFDAERVQNWLDLYGLGEPHQIHASGHASGPEVFEMLEAIGPKTIFPVHTESASLFAESFKQVKRVELGKTYRI